MLAAVSGGAWARRDRTARAPRDAARRDRRSRGEFGWTAMLSGTGRYFQARALDPVRALAFDAVGLRRMCDEDTAFGYALMRRLLVRRGGPPAIDATAGRRHALDAGQAGRRLAVPRRLRVGVAESRAGATARPDLRQVRDALAARRVKPRKLCADGHLRAAALPDRAARQRHAGARRPAHDVLGDGRQSARSAGPVPARRPGRRLFARAPALLRPRVLPRRAV